MYLRARAHKRPKAHACAHCHALESSPRAVQEALRCAGASSLHMHLTLDTSICKRSADLASQPRAGSKAPAGLLSSTLGTIPHDDRLRSEAEVEAARFEEEDQERLQHEAEAKAAREEQERLQHEAEEMAAREEQERLQHER